MKDTKEYKIKECWTCRWYRAFYTRGYAHFDRQDCGLCCKNDITQKHNTCDKWEYNTKCSRQWGRKIRRETALRQLNEILNNLTEVGQIIKEEHEEDF